MYLMFSIALYSCFYSNRWVCILTGSCRFFFMGSCKMIIPTSCLVYSVNYLACILITYLVYSVNYLACILITYLVYSVNYLACILITYLVYSVNYLACILIATRASRLARGDIMGFVVYNNHPCPGALPLESGDYSLIPGYHALSHTLGLATL